MARPHRCDVPGCTRTRRRWQRLCEPCWSALPRDIRTAILETHRAGRKPAWREACKRAGQHMAPILTPGPIALSPSKGTTPQQAYAAHQRLLGEHD